MPESNRLPLIGDGTDEARVRAVFERSLTAHGRVPNLYRTLGHAPAMLDAWVGFAWTLRSDPETPRSLRELVILRVATALDSEYELTHHRPMALDAGCSAEQVDRIADWRSHGDLYSAAERAAIAVAERIAVGDSLGADEWTALRGHFDEGACVEVVLTASFYVCVGRILDVFEVPLEHDT